MQLKLKKKKAILIFDLIILTFFTLLILIPIPLKWQTRKEMHILISAPFICAHLILEMCVSDSRGQHHIIQP